MSGLTRQRDERGHTTKREKVKGHYRLVTRAPDGTIVTSEKWSPKGKAEPEQAPKGDAGASDGPEVLNDLPPSPGSEEAPESTPKEKDSAGSVPGDGLDIPAESSGSEEAPADQSGGDSSGIVEGSSPSPSDPFSEFLQTLEDEFTTIKERLLGLELTIKQMGAAPQPADPLKGLMEGPLGPSIKDIIKEIPGMIRSFTGGGTTDLARLIAVEIDVREKARLEARAKVIAEAISSDKTLKLEDREK